MKSIKTLLIGVICGVSGVVGAEDAPPSHPPSGFSFCGRYGVEAVQSGNRLLLGDGTILHLAAVRAPMIPRDGQYFKAWPLANWVREAVAARVVGESIALFCAGEAFDHRGERRALARLSDGGWLQDSMLREGLALVDYLGNDLALTARLYGQEAQARQRVLGVWGNPAYHRRAAGDVAAIREGFFEIIVGRVTTATLTRKVTYINFGDAYGEDFTLEASPKVTKAFLKTGVDLATLGGKRIEVRGWVDWAGGPRITLTAPSQLRFLEPQ